jgi:hypothetical protein
MTRKWKGKQALKVPITQANLPSVVLNSWQHSLPPSPVNTPKQELRTPEKSLKNKNKK